MKVANVILTSPEIQGPWVLAAEHSLGLVPPTGGLLPPMLIGLLGDFQVTLEPPKQPARIGGLASAAVRSTLPTRPGFESTLMLPDDIVRRYGWRSAKAKVVLGGIEVMIGCKGGARVVLGCRTSREIPGDTMELEHISCNV